MINHCIIIKMQSLKLVDALLQCFFNMWTSEYRNHKCVIKSLDQRSTKCTVGQMCRLSQSYLHLQNPKLFGYSAGNHYNYICNSNQPNSISNLKAPIAICNMECAVKKLRCVLWRNKNENEGLKDLRMVKKQYDLYILWAEFANWI